VENLPFKGGPGAAPSVRGYGAVNGQEALSGKRIHALWQLRLEQACRSGKPTRVLLHNAYFFPPSNLLATLGKMIDGRLECRNVRLTILTNSIQTTDLSMVNVLARQSAKAFAEYAAKARDPMRAAQIEYYEYAPQPNTANVSLHTKVSVFDDDVLVGSANADVRSYMRDSNNGMYVRNAPRFASSYLGHIDQMLADRIRTTNMVDYFVNITRDEMRREDRVFYRRMIERYRAEKLLSPAQIDNFEDVLIGLLERVYTMSSEIIRGNPEAEAEFNRLFKAI
jgi:cardiolipin synthase C